MTSTLTVVVTLLACAGTLPAQESSAPKLKGVWRLVVLYYAEDPFVTIEFTGDGEQLTGTPLSAQRFLGDPKVEEIRYEGGNLTLRMRTASGSSVFRGTWDADKGVFRGTFFFRQTVYPAVLEPTEQREVGSLGDRSLLTQVLRSRTQPVEQRVQQLKKLIEEHSGRPYLWPAYQILLQSAAEAGLPAEEVRTLTQGWLKDAGAYGVEWQNRVRLMALEALRGAKPYAELTLELATQSLESLSDDAPLEERARIVSIAAEAAALAGKADLAARYAAISEELEKKLDEEYLSKVPPFEPSPYKGRPDPSADRVVLFELFTGAECPPCVAADVAFDAVLESFKPTEVIGLQYHLHIPGPDPLTNPASEARARYYGIRGTPSTYFNGKGQAGGGGAMAASKAKYDQYRAIIEPLLYKKRTADITLDVRREGDTIRIAATGKLRQGDTGKTEGANSERRLKLFLIEHTVRYPGGNGIRFHHNVVRFMPGGPDGFVMENGEVKVDQEVSLAKVREELTKYLELAGKRMQFRHGVPPFETDDLAVVAILQDEATKEVLHAVLADVPSSSRDE